MDPTTVEDRGYLTRNLNICLIVFSTIIVALRCYVRQFMLKSFGWDDALSVAAWIILIVQSALEIVEVGNGSGRHMQDVTPAELSQFFSTLTTMELLYFIATCLVRLSIAAFLPRLSKEKKVLRITQALFILTIAMTLICFFVLLFECKHVPDVWDRLNPSRQCFSPQSESYLFWIHASIGIVIDVALFIIPIWLIYSRMMLSIATIKVILVFGVGLFVLVTGIVRLVIIVSVQFGVDTTWQMPKLSTWADLEGHIGLWVACFPSLPPIIRRAAQRVGLRTKSQPKGSSAGEANAWENNARTYVQSGSEVHLGIKENSVFDDDSSSKKMAAVEERDVGMEMDRIQWTKGH